MPIFEYRCSDCNHVTSFLEKAGARGPHACEACGSRQTEKCFSVFSAQASAPGACRTCPGADATAGQCTTGACPFSS